MLRGGLLVWIAAWCAVAQDGAEIRLKEAIALHQSGNVEGAIREYRAYLDLRPDSFPARSNLGAALARTGRYDEAISEYRQALALNPNVPQVVLNLALAYFKTDRIADATRELESVRKMAPNERQVIYLLADCYLRLGRNGDAIALLAPLEKASLEDQAFNYLYGTALVRDSQPQRGGVVIDRILRNGDSAEARLLLGTTKMAVRDYRGALPDLEKAVELNPKLPGAHSYYGQALLGMGDTSAAAGAFRKELELNPVDFLSNLEMGVLSKQDQHYPEAREYFERALRARPGDPGVRYQIATVDLATGNVDGSRAMLEALVKESPQFTEAHVSLATVYYRLKRKEDGDRERALVQRLLAEQQAKQPGVNVK